MTDYPERISLSYELLPNRSIIYNDVSTEYKIGAIDKSNLGVLTQSKWNILVKCFENHFYNREICGNSEYDFFCCLQDVIDRNADTFERQLEVYDSDIAKPILGRTETTTFNRTNQFVSDGNNDSTHIENPADDPANDPPDFKDNISTNDNRTESYGGSVVTELSDLGVKPNYETMNGFLEQNKTFISFFLERTEECFLKTYIRVII